MQLEVTALGENSMFRCNLNLLQFDYVKSANKPAVTVLKTTSEDLGN